MTSIHLYIDPGTGSMLFSLLIGLISAGVYALRNALIKLRFFLSGGRKEAADHTSLSYAIFSDSKRYWNVFEPICDEFEKRETPVSYLTASPDDPALSKDFQYVNCEFIGEGNRAFTRLNMLKSTIVLSTTPGLDVYQWKRSRDVAFYAHILHAISDASLYRMFGIDYYDAVLVSGSFQQDQVREMERLRNLPRKETPLVGLTYIDAMKKRLDAYTEQLPSLEDGVALGEHIEVDSSKEYFESPHETTVLLAPSWGQSAIFSLYGGKIIEALLATGYHVIVRPHPQSFTSEKDLIDTLMCSYPASNQLEWNRDNDNFEVLRKSDIMISDFSGVIFDFALVFNKPVIYTEPQFDSAPYDACWLEKEPWTFTTLPTIGKQLSIDHLDALKGLIDDCLQSKVFALGREKARSECWAHQGESARLTVDYLMAKYEELTSLE